MASNAAIQGLSVGQRHEWALDATGLAWDTPRECIQKKRRGVFHTKISQKKCGGHVLFIISHEFEMGNKVVRASRLDYLWLFAYNIVLQERLLNIPHTARVIPWVYRNTGT